MQRNIFQKLQGSSIKRLRARIWGYFMCERGRFAGNSPSGKSQARLLPPCRGDTCPDGVCLAAGHLEK